MILLIFGIVDIIAGLILLINHPSLILLSIILLIEGIMSLIYAFIRRF